MRDGVPGDLRTVQDRAAIENAVEGCSRVPGG
jgi:hypothetical protein